MRLYKFLMRIELNKSLDKTIPFHSDCFIPRVNIYNSFHRDKCSNNIRAKQIYFKKSWSGENRTHKARGDRVTVCWFSQFTITPICGKYRNRTPAFTPAPDFKSGCSPMNATFQEANVRIELTTFVLQTKINPFECIGRCVNFWNRTKSLGFSDRCFYQVSLIHIAENRVFETHSLRAISLANCYMHLHILFSFCTRGRTWTYKPKCRILSPVRLPISPHEHLYQWKDSNLQKSCF